MTLTVTATQTFPSEGSPEETAMREAASGKSLKDGGGNPNHDPETGRFSSGGGGSEPEDPVIAAARQGGGTINAENGSSPTTGYAVAVQGHSSITPSDKFFADDGSGKPAGVAITSQWLADNSALFDENPDIHIGVWNDTEHSEVVLDPAEVMSDRSTAIQAGIDRNQQAIYDIAADKEISTGGTGDRPDG